MKTIEYGVWTCSNAELDTVSRVAGQAIFATVPAPSRCAARLREIRDGWCETTCRACAWPKRAEKLTWTSVTS